MMRRYRKSLSNQITLVLSLFSVAVVVLSCLLLSGIFYVALDTQASETLTREAQAIAALTDDKDGDDEIRETVIASSAYIPDDTRLTLIGNDGTVLYDSMAEEAEMPNHLQRPEVMEAQHKGEARFARYSETLQKETLYYSVLLSNSMVLRLSTTQDSVLGIVAALLVPGAVLLLGVVFGSSVAGRVVARRISASVGNIDLDRPLRVDTYEELVPLLCRIDDQRKRLDAQASERRAFTANVSHELKTPLTIISGYGEIIANGLAKPEDVKQFSHLIHAEARRMKGMVDDLIELSHLDDMSGSDHEVDLTAQVNLTDVVQEVVDRMAPLADEYKVSLGFVQGAGVAQIIQGNNRILDELVGNLVQNAIRYNVEGGYVHVTLQREDRNLVLRVIDSGVGIPEELQERVFERFYRVDVSRSKETGGSGLGLAIVKHAAQIHGATASLANNMPQGTIAEVSFPLQRPHES